MKISCFGKIQYDTRNIATKALRNKTILNVYRCPHCNKYHIGNHKPQRVTRKKEALMNYKNQESLMELNHVI